MKLSLKILENLYNKIAYESDDNRILMVEINGEYMSLTPKGSKILKAMVRQYGVKKGKEVFYASINEGKITGAERNSKKKK